jgi:asparagine synthase (glutamine-hydrolysing)
MQVCAGQFAAKSHDPLRSRGLLPLYPFLNPSMLQLSFSLPWDVKCTKREEKALLKKLLARTIPPELVYREKSGFNAPVERIMRTHVIQEYLHDIVLSDNNPVQHFLITESVEAMIDHICKEKYVIKGVHNFLWCLVFVSAWLKQCGFSR